MPKERLHEIAEIMEGNLGIGGGHSSWHEHEDAEFSPDDADGEYWEAVMGGPDDADLESYEDSLSHHELEGRIQNDPDVEEGSLSGGGAVNHVREDNRERRPQEIVEWLAASPLARKFRAREGFFIPKGPQVRLTDGTIVDVIEWLLREGIRGGAAICGYSIVYTTSESKYGERLSFSKVVVDAPFPRISGVTSGPLVEPSGRTSAAPSQASPNAPTERAYTVEEKRQENAMAYAKWTKDEDDRLRQLFAAGRTIDELATDFRRNRGANQSRISKLNLSR